MARETGIGKIPRMGEDCCSDHLCGHFLAGIAYYVSLMIFTGNTIINDSHLSAYHYSFL